ncbi:MAG TPA: hypothetical protein VL426_05460 [Candidatus Binatia bacterium]|jgi:hypothetical protein|nr:hypothetical protein [Candidatus Binatia bacterium]
MLKLARRILATTLIVSALLFSVFHAGLWGGFAHAAHGSMGAAADCMSAGCPSESPSDSTDCASHCLAAAGTERDVVPPLAAFFVLLTATLVVYGTKRAAEFVAERREEWAGKFMVHQRLATIVLRN